MGFAPHGASELKFLMFGIMLITIRVRPTRGE